MFWSVVGERFMECHGVHCCVRLMMVMKLVLVLCKIDWLTPIMIFAGCD